MIARNLLALFFAMATTGCATAPEVDDGRSENAGKPLGQNEPRTAGRSTPATASATVTFSFAESGEFVARVRHRGTEKSRAIGTDVVLLNAAHEPLSDADPLAELTPLGPGPHPCVELAGGRFGVVLPASSPAVPELDMATFGSAESKEAEAHVVAFSTAEQRSGFDVFAEERVVLREGLLQRALTAKADGELDSAIFRLSLARKLDPVDPDLRHMLAVFLGERGAATLADETKFEAAEMDLDAATMLEPSLRGTLEGNFQQIAQIKDERRKLAELERKQAEERKRRKQIEAQIARKKKEQEAAKTRGALLGFGGRLLQSGGIQGGNQTAEIIGQILATVGELEMKKAGVDSSILNLSKQIGAHNASISKLQQELRASATPAHRHFMQAQRQYLGDDLADAFESATGLSSHAGSGGMAFDLEMAPESIKQQVNQSPQSRQLASGNIERFKQLSPFEGEGSGITGIWENVGGRPQFWLLRRGYGYAVQPVHGAASGVIIVSTFTWQFDERSMVMTMGPRSGSFAIGSNIPIGDVPTSRNQLRWASADRASFRVNQQMMQRISPDRWAQRHRELLSTQMNELQGTDAVENNAMGPGRGRRR